MAAKTKRRRKKFTRAPGAGRPPTGVEKKRIIAFRMPADMMDLLKVRAAKQRVSRNMLTERILWDYLNRSDDALQALIDNPPPIVDREAAGAQPDLFA